MLARKLAGRASLVAVLAAAALVGCGASDSTEAGSQGTDDGLLAVAIAEGMTSGGAMPFDDPSALCIAEEIVGSVGVDRLGELGFSVESVPDQLHADWTAGEVETVIGSIDGCTDVEALTRETVARAVGEDGANCVLDAIGADFFVVTIRAELTAGADEVAIAIAQDEATEPFSAAVGSCVGSSSGVPTLGGEPDPSNPPAAAENDPAATAEEAAAASALLTARDLGPEWFEQPRVEQDDPGFDEMASGVMAAEPACVSAATWAERHGVGLADFTNALVPEPLARAESASLIFGPDSVSEVEHTVSVFGSADEVTDSLRLAGEVEWPACLRAVFGDLMQAQFEAVGGGLSITEYSATEPPVVGDHSIAVRFELIIEVAEDASTVANTIEFSIVGLGRATSAVTMFSFDGAIDDQMDDIVAQAADKVARQFGAEG